MTTISAKVVADSVGRDAPRLLTFVLRYPRFVHPELLTHKALSRNARSSRAVPIAKMIAEVESDPVIPLYWGAAEPGMQSRRELDGPARIAAECHWRAAARDAVEHARRLATCGAHKQLANRILEPFLHIDTLVTATAGGWDGFFGLRDHPDAEPHMQMLAKAIRQAMGDSEPAWIDAAGWHLPYVSASERRSYDTVTLRDLSAARCARISWEPFDGEPSIPREMERAEKLISAAHWSPFEHQATPDKHRADGVGGTDGWLNRGLHRNLTGWCQNRAILEAA